MRQQIKYDEIRADKAVLCIYIYIKNYGFD